MTIYHYSEAGTLAVCGQLADGVNHTNEIPVVLERMATLPMMTVCPSCLAVARERVAGMTTTTGSLGETIARNINDQLDRLGWDYDRLSVETGLSWGEIVSWRSDASGMDMNQLWDVAVALGVSAAVLVGGEDR